MRAQLKYLVAPVLALGVGLVAGTQGGRGGNELLFMNVGQGDCTVLMSAGATMLVDVGPKSPSGDAGERIVVPELRRYGLRPDVIMLTHPDVDHVGGLSAVMRAFPDATVLVNAEFQTSKHMMDELRQAQVSENQIRWLPPHASIDVGEFSAEMYSPPWRVGEDDNGGSVVTRVSHGSASAVLMGDAGFKTEFALVGVRDWTSQVLKVGHHGSRFSTSDAWLKAVRPTWGVISCGLNNRYGHPHRDTLDRLRNAGVKPLRTDESGDVWFREGASGFEPE